MNLSWDRRGELSRLLPVPLMKEGVRAMRGKNFNIMGFAKPPFMFLLAVVLLLNFVVLGQEFDTLYLRDGSVLRGDIVKDSVGNYVVYNQYGEFTVNVGEVIYLISKEKDEQIVRETYIITGNEMEVVSILQRAIPSADEDLQGFNLLVAGSVVAIFDADNFEIPYQSTSLGGLSKITIKYDDIISDGKYLYITTRQKDFLESNEGGIIYSYNFTPHNEVVIKLLVKYPQDWHVDKISPEPTKQYEGLIVWQLKLRRQQNFIPTITFRK